MKKDLSLDGSSREKLLSEIDTNSKILEIGPLNSPMFNKKDADVSYADINSTEDIKKEYSFLGQQDLIDSIVPIDFVIEDSYENTFKNTDIRFDYVVSSHVLEHIPNPIDHLLDVSKILNLGGKVCFLLPDKEFTFDYYRETSSVADLYDVYVRGEANNTPRFLLDNKLFQINENYAPDFWDNGASSYPNPDVESILDEYFSFIDDFDNNYFSGHYWVFTDQSFLRILGSLYMLNLIPYKLFSFYPTSYNSNTFGLILELDYSIQNDSELRKNQIHEIYDIHNRIGQLRFEKKANSIIQENIQLKEKINKITDLLK